MKRVEISLNFMPAFYNKHIGTRYGEAYYFDPSYRAEVERSEGRFLHEVLGSYGVGSPDPQPNPSIFIQPIDVVMRTQGAEWRFPEDGCVESWSAPWKNLTVEEIAGIDPEEAAHHAVIDAIIAEYRTMQRMYGEQADIFGTKSGVMGIHTPYTTALQLYGEELLVVMLTDPETTRIILDKVWRIYQAIFRRISGVTGARLAGIHLGDCSAAILAERTYRDVVLPVNRRLAAEFERASYHSCGPSSHLVSAFASLPNLGYIELGPGTDLRASACLMPNVHIAPLVDPIVVREGDSDAVHDEVEKILMDTRTSPRVTLCAWSFDRDTPIENVARIYSTVQSHEPSPARSAHKGTTNRIV